MAWLATVLAHRDAVTEMAPWMYGLATDGQIDPPCPTGQTAAVAPAHSSAIWPRLSLGYLAAGPDRPAGWIRDVLGYAKTQIPASKIILGIPLYGYAAHLRAERAEHVEGGAVMPWRALAVLIPAHNKALAIADSLAAIMALVPPRNVTDTRVQPGCLAAALPMLGSPQVVAVERQPRLLLLATFFPFMRMLDAAISLDSVPAAWWSASSGRWKSPARRPVSGAATAALPAASRLAGGAYPDGTRNEPGTPARVAEASHVSG